MQEEESKSQKHLRIARQYAEKRLNGELLEHTLGCADTARKLAGRFNLDKDAAETASHLHDIAKTLSHEGQADLAGTMGMSAFEIDSYPRAVLHGPLAAIIARDELGIDDPEILQAIAAHSTGCASMCDLAKTVFVADYIELTRSFPGAEELRGRRNVTLDGLTTAILSRKLRYLLEDRKDIDSRAIDLWNELVNQSD